MKWFDIYKSNTLAGSGNQLYFMTHDKDAHIGRIYYKVYAGGRYNYSLLFSNIIDSTYFDGTHSHCNLIVDEWEILYAAIGVCNSCNEIIAGEVEKFYHLTFDGKSYKKVMPGEFFASDAVEIYAIKDTYLCLEIEYRGNMIPYHKESILPVFVKENGQWIPSKFTPFVGMIGCDRTVKAKIGFLGDSITQGIGTAINSYLHWSALVAESIGEEYSYWNLGIGYGRIGDVSSGGAWLFKAKQMDVIVICCGINDICHGRTEKQIKKDLLTVITELQSAGVKVMIQTIPPFNLQDENLKKWLNINDYIRHTLINYVNGMFDVVPVLLDGRESECKARYGGHPNEEGCKAWAEALTPVLKDFLTMEK